MMVRAKVSFAGKINMMRGKCREIADEAMLNDLLKAGYVEEITDEQPKNEDTEPKKAKKKRKADEGE